LVSREIQGKHVTASLGERLPAGGILRALTLTPKPVENLPHRAGPGWGTLSCLTMALYSEIGGNV
jgi:hypothetical protein